MDSLKSGSAFNQMYNEVQDPINPSHYKQGKYETIDIIMDRVKTLPGEQAALVANIIRYLWRYDNKNGLEDIKKMLWYGDRLFEEVMESEHRGEE